MMMKMVLMILKQKSNHRNSRKKILILRAHPLLLPSRGRPYSLFLLKFRHL